jgi:hypothetical protein
MTSGAPKHPPIKARSIDAIGRDVRRLAFQTWGHQYQSFLWLETFRPRYEVPGRRRNGSIKGKARIKWVLGRMALPIWAFVISIVSVFADGEIASVRRKDRVKGEPGCQALGFADSNQPDQQSVAPDALWLLYSTERAILCKLRSQKTNPHLEVLWRAEGPGKPHIDGYKRTITWPDGSAVILAES